ncbi:3' terminal RNA ribose 2'-O-methyltransferase Hen1 [Actinospica robiniae]|uniref:3' terminal RNA ribose 2'-O-methyltransferase Hen1 n=1 Tax=Actinospica robiniae TaxID=304901 RepID=UPI000427B964|nr:3' terminal RNA ribose 2'-O-methyltransferase Hen1 [Actinospica robiniae]
MLVTITATRPPGAEWAATDLGYLLAKNPATVQSFSHGFGRSRVFYPEADEGRCTAALYLEIDPIGLIKSRNLDSADFSLSQYVNDRPYAATSLLAGAIGQVFRTAIRGTSKERPELAATALPLTLRLPVVPATPELIERLFTPLGWAVTATPLPLDPAFPEWGESRYCDVELSGEQRVSDALSQLYVLLPVLDGSKHYWIDAAEVEKLLRAGEAWLAGHPDRELITRRYLGRRPTLVRSALARLAESDEVPESELDNAVSEDADGESETVVDGAAGAVDAVGAAGAAGATADAEEPRVSLATQRHHAVVAALKDVGGKAVLDLGCGGGALLQHLLNDRYFREILGVDVSVRALQYAARKLRLERLPEAVASRLTLKQGSLTYTDSSLKGFDAAVLMEVIEHVDPPRLASLEHAVFGAARPGAVIVTTPNVEYNVRYETLEAGRLRHRDHRFEWSRDEFGVWARDVASQYGYEVEFRTVGEVDEEVGSPTQLALFRRSDAREQESGQAAGDAREGGKITGPTRSAESHAGTAADDATTAEATSAAATTAELTPAAPATAVSPRTAAPASAPAPAPTPAPTQAPTSATDAAKEAN